MIDIRDQPLRDPADICELLSMTINEVRSGKVQPRVATAVGYELRAVHRRKLLATPVLAR